MMAKSNVSNCNYPWLQKGNEQIQGSYKLWQRSAERRMRSSRAVQVRIIINHSKSEQMASDAKVKFSQWTTERGGGSVFLPLSLWERRGLRTCWNPTKHWRGAGGGGGGGSYPTHPQLHTVLMPSTPPLPWARRWWRSVCEESIIEAEWSGTSRIVPSCPVAPHRLTPPLPPPFSKDKECPECLASPAVSNN